MKIVDGVITPITKEDIESIEIGKLSLIPVVPSSVTMRQARLALLAAGLLDDVNTLIASIGQEAAITWEFATEVQRNNELVIAVLTSKGFTENQIDDLFVSADKL